MKELLCKAKRKDNGEWIVGYYCPKKAYCFDNRVPPIHTIISEFSNTGVVSKEIDINTLCKCVGIEVYCEKEDINSILWENDILEIKYNGKVIQTEVKYENGTFILGSDEFTDGYIPLLDVIELEETPYIRGKVIGNTFDNISFYPKFSITELKWNIPEEDKEFFDLPDTMIVPIEYYSLLNEKDIEDYLYHMTAIPCNHFVLECNMSSIDIQNLIDAKERLLSTLNSIKQRDLIEKIKIEIENLKYALNIHRENEYRKDKDIDFEL